MGLVKLDQDKEIITEQDLQRLADALNEVAAELRENFALDVMTKFKVQALRFREMSLTIPEKPSKKRKVDKAKLELELDMNLLMSTDIDVVRSACDEHKPCDDCGECTKCTIPHWCCCGKCGAKCNHEHAPIKSVCFRMQEIHHDIFTANNRAHNNTMFSGVDKAKPGAEETVYAKIEGGKMTVIDKVTITSDRVKGIK